MGFSKTPVVYKLNMNIIGTNPLYFYFISFTLNENWLATRKLQTDLLSQVTITV